MLTCVNWSIQKGEYVTSHPMIERFSIPHSLISYYSTLHNRISAWCNRIFISKRSDVKQVQFLAPGGFWHVQCPRSVGSVPNTDVHSPACGTNILKAYDCWSMTEVADMYMYTLSREQRKGACRYKIVTMWSNLLYISVASPRNASEYKYLLK